MRRAVSSEADIPFEPLGPDFLGDVRAEELERHGSPVLYVAGEKHRGHPPAPQLPLGDIPIGEGRPEWVGEAGQEMDP
jgi:hypothetical protein